jgi:hypothetical protein
MLGKWQSLLLLLPERYPHLVSDEQVLHAIESVRGEIGKFGQWALTFSLSSLPLLVNAMIYLVLVPILVFFFLKDRELIGRWVSGYLPRQRTHEQGEHQYYRQPRRYPHTLQGVDQALHQERQHHTRQHGREHAAQGKNSRESQKQKDRQHHCFFIGEVALHPVAKHFEH